MACLNMQINNEQQQQGGGFLGPRISFSNDFGDTQQATQQPNIKHNMTYREAPVSSEFNFAVPCFASNSADEIFFKAKILPLKENNKAAVTLRDELLNDDDDDIFLPKSSGWWKFGRSQTTQSVNHNNACLAAKKGGDHKNHGGLDTIDEGNQYLRK